MAEMYEDEIDTYEIGYSKFGEIAVCHTITWKYETAPKEETQIQFNGTGLNKYIGHHNTSKVSSEYNDMMELKKRYEWIEVPYTVYKHMLQYINDRSPL